MGQNHRAWNMFLGPRTFLFYALALVWTGCSSTYYVVPERKIERGDTVSVARFNKRHTGLSAIVRTRSGEEYATSDVVLTKDSCSFLGEGPDGRLVLPTKDIQSIRHNESLRGAVGGMALGLLGGISVGGAVLMGTNSSSASNGWGPAIVAGSIVILGTVGGVVYGAVHGSNIEYQFQAPQDSLEAIRPQAKRE